MRKYLLVLTCFLSFSSNACSLSPAFENFVITESSHVEAIKPNFSVSSIHRGSNNRNLGSCSDAGFIELELGLEHSEKQGYIFEIAEGKFEDQLFSNSPVIPSKFMDNKNIYSFVWLDGSNEEQEPINIVIKIVAVSLSGHKSEPQLLKIKHPGIKKPWWKIW